MPQWQVVPARISQNYLFPTNKTTFFKSQKLCFWKQMQKQQNRANLASGVPQSEYTRKLDTGTAIESSVAIMGASLVTKQAGRVPQHKYSKIPCGATTTTSTNNNNTNNNNNYSA